MPHINKEQWKNVIRPKIYEFHERRIKQKLNRSSLYRFIHPGDFSLLDKKLSPILTTARTNKQLLATAITIKHMVMEINNGENLRRKKQVKSSSCIFCQDDIKDTSEHMLWECQLVRGSSAANQTKLEIFEKMAVACTLPLNRLLCDFWNKKDTMSLFCMNPSSEGLPTELRIDQDNPLLPEVILKVQYYILLVSALRIRYGNNKKVRRDPKKPGKTHQKRQGKNIQNAPGNSKFTKARRRINRSLNRKDGECSDSFQVSLVDGDENSKSLVWRKMEDLGIHYQSLVCSVANPGVTPILTTSPSKVGQGRRLEHKTGVWSVSEFEAWNKGIQVNSSFTDITSKFKSYQGKYDLTCKLSGNIECFLVEGFGYEEAQRLADLAPIKFFNPELKNDERR